MDNLTKLVFITLEFIKEKKKKLFFSCFFSTQTRRNFIILQNPSACPPPVRQKNAPYMVRLGSQA